jgi:Flp pilus assembly protein TadB
VSKARALARAEREAAAQARIEAAAEQRRREATARARKHRRALAWRRVRVWQSRPGAPGRRDKTAALAAFVFVALVLAYVFTGSFGAVVLVALVLLVATPVLVLILFERRRP